MYDNKRSDKIVGIAGSCYYEGDAMGIRFAS